MRILGIDPGLNVTGYGIIEVPGKDNFVLIEAGVIKSSHKNSLPQRLCHIYNELFKIISEHKPQALILEKIFSHYKHPATIMYIAYTRALVCLLCGQENIIFYEYSATRIKKIITGKGHASKEQIQKMILHLLNIKSSFPYADATDALALAIGHCRLRNPVFSSNFNKRDKIIIGKK